MGQCAKCNKSYKGTYPLCYGCKIKKEKEEIIKHGKAHCKKCRAVIPKNKPGLLCPLCRYKSR
jgi:hypothetical protein